MRSLYLAVGPGRTASASLALYFGAFADSRTLGDIKLTVSQECLGVKDTRPERFFRAFDSPTQRLLLNTPAVSRFLARLDGLSADESYMDLGWTMYPLIPALIDRYGSRVKVIILSRHPIVAAASHTLHGLHEDAADWEFGIRREFLTPRNSQTFQAVSHDEWERMSPFLRNLWRVNEILSFGLELQSLYPQAGIRLFRYEDYGAGLGRAIARHFEFADDPPDSMPRFNQTRRYRRAARGTPFDVWSEAADWTGWYETARDLGYTVSREAIEELRPVMARYEPHGAVEHAVRAAYGWSLARVAWRRLVVPVVNRVSARSRRGTVFEARYRS